MGVFNFVVRSGYKIQFHRQIVELVRILLSFRKKKSALSFTKWNRNPYDWINSTENFKILGKLF